MNKSSQKGAKKPLFRQKKGLTMENLLSLILCLPALGALGLLCVPNSQTRVIRVLGLSISFLTFVFSLLLWVFFDHSTDPRKRCLRGCATERA